MPKITDRSNHNFAHADPGLALHDNEKIIHAGASTSETKKTISNPAESPFHASRTLIHQAFASDICSE